MNFPSLPTAQPAGVAGGAKTGKQGEGDADVAIAAKLRVEAMSPGEGNSPAPDTGRLSANDGGRWLAMLLVYRLDLVFSG